MEFRRWPKIPRLNREMIITEKIDGSNAQIFIDDATNYKDLPERTEPYIFLDEFVILAGSRNRWLSLDKDNFGFGKWVVDHQEELLKLGPGRHYGEWWGLGIQRNYGLTEKRLSLFNVSQYSENKPECCDIVPVLYEGLFSQGQIDDCVTELSLTGSVAVPGFMKPEGVVVFHNAAHQAFKVTCEGDEGPKGVIR